MSDKDKIDISRLFDDSKILDEKYIQKKLQERNFSGNIISEVRKRKAGKRPIWRLKPLYTPREIFAFALIAVFLITAINIFLNIFALKNSAHIRQTAQGENGAHKIVVEFRLVLPQAGHVQLVGDFSQWQKGKFYLKKKEQNTWTIKLPLEKGRYQYQFLIDDKKWIPDPNCPKQIDDGFGRKNSLLVI